MLLGMPAVSSADMALACGGLQVLDGHGCVRLGFYRGCYFCRHRSNFGAGGGGDVQRRLVMIVGSFSAEVHQQVDGVGDARRVLGGLEDGLVGFDCCSWVAIVWQFSFFFPTGDAVAARRGAPGGSRRRGSASPEELTKYAAEPFV